MTRGSGELGVTKYKTGFRVGFTINNRRIVSRLYDTEAEAASVARALKIIANEAIERQEPAFFEDASKYTNAAFVSNQRFARGKRVRNEYPRNSNEEDRDNIAPNADNESAQVPVAAGVPAITMGSS
jgi:hypothetical protein